MINSNWDLPQISESSVDPSDSLQLVYDQTGPIPFPKVDTPKSLVLEDLINKGATFDLDDKGQILSYIISQNISAQNIYFDVDTLKSKSKKNINGHKYFKYKKNVQSVLDKYGIVCQNVDSIEVSIDEQNPNVHKITIEKYIF